MNEAALLEKAKAGDTSALESLLSMYEQRIYRFGLRMCGNPADAQDVLQETMLAAFKNVSSFRGDASLSTWLFQVARSFCVKQRRGGAAAPHLNLESSEVKGMATTATPDDSRVHARQVGEVISAAIASLPAEAREALVLRDVEGLSAEEAADVVGIEVGALKSRLHRARVALKQQLAAVLDEQPQAVACPELAQELSAYAGSDIDQAACARIEQHLQGCAACSAACDALKRTVSLCRAIPGGDVPAPVKAAVRKALSAHA